MDKEKKGYLTAEELKQVLTSEGEVFTAEEMEEMINSALDPFEGKIFYDVSPLDWPVIVEDHWIFFLEIRHEVGVLLKMAPVLRRGGASCVLFPPSAT